MNAPNRSDSGASARHMALATVRAGRIRAHAPPGPARVATAGRRYPAGMYESPPGPEPGGCRETLLLTRIAFSVVVPVLLAVVGAMLLVILAFALFARHPLLVLLPLAILAAALWLLARRERARGDGSGGVPRRR